MATAIHQGGITNAFPGGQVTHFAPQQQQFPDPRAALYQLPGQMLASASQNYGSMTGGLAGIGQAIGGMTGQQSQALSGLGNAFAQNYGAYGNTLGNIASSAANDSTGYYNALSAAAGTNQAALGNMWTQALASAGGMGNALAASMGQGQTGYQQALAGMQGANQNAVSQYGQQRLNALARLGAADAVGNMQFDFGGGGGGNTFNATSPGGQVASGSYSMGGEGGGGGIGGGGADLSGYRNDIMDGGVLSQLASADTDARDRMDRQQDMYRKDYSNLFGQGLLGMMAMGREGSGSLRQGMTDFYGNVSQNRPNFGQYLDRATQGYRDSSSDIRGVGDRMSRDYGSGLGALAGLAGQIGSGMREANATGWDGVSQLLRRMAPTPVEAAQQNRQLQALRGGWASSDMAGSPYAAAYYRRLPAVRAAENRIPMMRRA
jgi:hypothetical protein